MKRQRERDRLIAEVKSCPECRDRTTPTLVAAAASVGIERKKPGDWMLMAYLLGYHRRDHVDPA